MEREDGIFVDINSLSHTAGFMRQSLQTLLASVDAVTERLDPEDGENVRHLSSAMRSIFQLIRISDNLEIFSLLKKEAYPLCKVPAGVFAEVREVADRAAELLAYQNIDLEIRLPENDFTGCIDRALLRLMLWNLLSNASAHAADHRICLSAERSGRDEILLYLTNREEGARLLETERLFDRYSSDPEDLRARDGLGVGLRLVLEAARLHGGSLMLSASPEGLITAMLRLNTEKASGTDVHSPILLPEQSLNDGLIGLSGILPAEVYDPRDIL